MEKGNADQTRLAISDDDGEPNTYAAVRRLIILCWDTGQVVQQSLLDQ
jgi:hypothetical protein